MCSVSMTDIHKANPIHFQYLFSNLMEKKVQKEKL